MVLSSIPTWTREAFDILIMVVFLAYIFKDIIRPQRGEDILAYVDNNVSMNDVKSKLWQDDIWFTIAVVAPCIILHELAHKFIAIGFGYSAEFFAFYHQPFTLVLAVVAVLSVMYNWGFLLIVPGFVQIMGSPPPGITGLIAFAGPAIHAAFWLASKAALRYQWSTNRTHEQFWRMTKKLNGFLFIFNMLPLPGIDGFTVYTSLFQLL